MSDTTTTPPSDVELAAGQTKEDALGTSLTVHGETAATAIEAQAKAAIQARYTLAVARPRKMDQVRQDLLKDCRRPDFAETARYVLPMGTAKVRGFSIRFAEAAMAAMGNIFVETVTIFDDDTRRIISVSVTDLERNTTFQRPVTIRKVVERKKLRRGQEPIRTRVNSYGDTVYEVEATEEEVMRKEASAQSRIVRNGVLRLIPGDLRHECEQTVARTINDRAAKDPDHERKALADGFEVLGVTAADLHEYLGHDLGKCSPAQLASLREIYTSIRDGELTWVGAKDIRDVEVDDAKPRGEREREKAEDEKKSKGTRRKKAPDGEPVAAEVIGEITKLCMEHEIAPEVFQEIKEAAGVGADAEINALDVEQLVALREKVKQHGGAS